MAAKQQCIRTKNCAYAWLQTKLPDSEFVIYLGFICYSQ